MLINLRDALMAGKRLPYDAEVEYLESTGTQWIDTGLPGVDGYTFKADFMYTSLYSGYNYLAGSGVSSSSRVYFTRRGKGDGSDSYFRLTYNISSNAPQQSVNINEWVSVTSIAEKGHQEVIVNGLTVYTSSLSSPVETLQNIFLFCASYGESATTGQCAAKLRRAQFFYNNTLVRDYIPVRKGTVGYLYDRISGKLFGNAGTGDFQYGQDVVPVEYIESSGTQWIDTGVPWVKSNDGSSADISFDIAFTALTGRKLMLSNGFGFFGHNASGNMEYSNNVFDAITVGRRYAIDISLANGSYEFEVDGVQKKAATFSATFNGTYYLWTITSSGTPSASFAMSARIYRCEISHNGTFVRSFRPVRVGTDATSWEGAMMDTLTRRIYRNAGTGAFTYGNDLPYPIPAS